MAQPATGAAILFGLRRELAPGVPDTTQARTYYRPAPPLAAYPVRTLNPSPEINASGYRQRGLPGPITGPLDVGFMLSAGTFLEPLEHISGQVVKTEPETDIFQYVVTPIQDGVETTFDGIMSTPPVARHRFSMAAFSGWTLAFANNNPLVIRFGGLFGFDTHLGFADDDVDNTGTYTEGPDIRGNLRKPRAGESVYINVTRDVAGGGVQVKLERVPDGGAAPTFPSAALDVAYDEDGNGTWQNAAGAYQLTGTVTVGAGSPNVAGTGTRFTQELEVGKYLTIGPQNLEIQSITDDDTLVLAANHTAGATDARAYLINEDFGYWDENYDPVEFIYPGDVTAHGDLDIGDMHAFPETWDDPTPTYISGQRFTAAHIFLDHRQVGATTWNTVQMQAGSWANEKAVSYSQGTGSRHPFSVDREGELVPTLQLSRKYTDDTFLEMERSHEPFEMRLRVLGQRLGTGAFRESIVLESGAAQVVSRTVPVSGPAAMIETINVAWNAEDDGSAPWVATVITDRDYTVAT